MISLTPTPTPLLSSRHALSHGWRRAEGRSNYCNHAAIAWSTRVRADLHQVPRRIGGKRPLLVGRSGATSPRSRLVQRAHGDELAAGGLGAKERHKYEL